MAHGHEPQPIPVVEYKIVDPSVLVAPDVHNNSAAFYGFNDGKEWTGGKENEQDTRYIRYLRELQLFLVDYSGCTRRKRAGLFCWTRRASRRPQEGQARSATAHQMATNVPAAVQSLPELVASATSSGGVSSPVRLCSSLEAYSTVPSAPGYGWY
jgi:hypothetical protein